MKKLFTIIALIFNIICYAQQPTILFSENFDAPSLDDSVLNSHNFFIKSQYAPPLQGNYYDSYIHYLDSTKAYFYLPTFSNTPIYENHHLYLEFDHIFRSDIVDHAVIEYTYDLDWQNGTYYPFPLNSYMGYGKYFDWNSGGGSLFFQKSSYEDWHYSLPPYDTVSSTWWKHELFYINVLIVPYPKHNVTVRFRFDDWGGYGSYQLCGWLIDNIKIFKTDYQIMDVADIKKEKISIYPNPFDDVIYFSKEVNDICVYDITGKKISYLNKGNKIEIPNLLKGLYILSYKTNEQIYNIKIFKK